MTTDELICTTGALSKFCDLVLQENPESVAIDTEFARSFSNYYPKLCLLQIACGRHQCVIDVLTEGMDLTPLQAIFDNTKIYKVFHDCRQDLEAISLLFPRIPRPIFDTQVAAMLTECYENSVGYSRLVEQFLDVKLNKLSFKRVDWTRRPLSESKIRYALDDVIYLDKLYWILKDILFHQGKLSWFYEEMEGAGAVIVCDNYVAMLEGMDFFFELTKEETIITLSLIEWRERVARLFNINRNIVMDSKTLLTVTKDLAASGIMEEGNLSKYVRNVYLQDLPFTLNEIVQNNEGKKSILHTTGGHDIQTLSVLNILLQSVCREKKVSQKLVATKGDLIKCINGVPNNVITGWRYELFGHKVESFMGGKTRLVISVDGTDNGLRLVVTE